MRGYQQASYPEPLLIELKEKGVGYELPRWDGVREIVELVPERLIRRSPLQIPNVSEPEVARHFFRLSQMNHCVEAGFYPLGSCTMKYNPKLGERLTTTPHLRGMHPLQPEDSVQGLLSILYELQRYLAEIGGMDEVTLQPAAGAHGEFTGMLMVRKYFEVRGEGRDEVIIPDSAHGTNPASAAMAGFKVVEIPSNGRGEVDLKALEAALSERTAAFMITNPNTLGKFEEDILEISDMVHDAGAILYYDGANLNAIMGWARPGDMGFDIMHFNLHKTFATPHGGGGPGSGPVGVKRFLKEYLPVPIVVKEGERYRLEWNLKHTIGKVRAYTGNVAVALRAWAYIRVMGREGLKTASALATLNSNYLRHLLEGILPDPYPGLKKHEFVLSSSRDGSRGEAREIAKALLDFGLHPPTVYFPLIVDEALMIEPTETEPKEEIERFAEVLRRIVKEMAPAERGRAPERTAAGRVDEVLAAKRLLLTWHDIEEGKA
ncbi:MAG: aminomethyl-transferring glycine dehydrogenase subunit GcvPB [Thermoplasmata archaeon]|nr:MAG: aminomethyl-transferring glycine dehydrogenase subunit GcvPB [Thermoplasmata archaeon]